jgi:hypothetical protein
MAGNRLTPIPLRVRFANIAETYERGGRATVRTATQVLSVLMLLIGVAILVRTLVEGGGALAFGIIVGVLFVAAGAGRLYAERRR